MKNQYKKIESLITLSREPFYKKTEKYISQLNNPRILDIGSGDGEFAKTIGKVETFMVENNPVSVESLKKHFPNVFQAKADKLPFDDEYFDLIHCSHLIEHLYPEEFYSFMKECDRVLRDGGFLCIAAPLMSPMFYWDLSHIKPYDPSIFKRYMVNGDESCTTRPLVSQKYEIIEECYRYYVVPPDDSEFFMYSEFLTKIYRKIKFILHKIGFRKLDKNGFFLVLRKNPSKE
jgi:SAM-dependent methyltransferase